MTLVAALLALNLAASLGFLPNTRTATTHTTHEVIRAKLIELVSADGRIVGQLHTAEDGSANLRLRNGSGEVRVKLGASENGAGLILMDGATQPGVWLTAAASGTALTLADPGKPKRVITP
ncbi:MAG: hypothetical protein WAT67_00890 [Candidatus Contendobacter sp.]